LVCGTVRKRFAPITSHPILLLDEDYFLYRITRQQMMLMNKSSASPIPKRIHHDKRDNTTDRWALSQRDVPK
jgi:hypothetical protein